MIITLLSYLLTRFLFFSIITEFIYSGDKIYNFVGINLSFLPVIISILFVEMVYHQKRYTVPFREFFIGFSIWFGFLILSLGFTLLDTDNNLIPSFDFPESIKFLILSLLLTPIQVLAEEMIFRGYLIHFLHSIKKNIWFKTTISGILFALPHLANPEVEGNITLFFLSYLVMGLLLSYLTVKYRSITYATGIHFANNFYAINIVNYPKSPLPTTPLFMDSSPINPLYTLIQIVILSTLIVIIIKKIEKLDFLSRKK